MRIPALGLLTIVMLLPAVPAPAQTYSPGYPVCLYAYRWGGSDADCSYTTMAQCQASGSGRGGTCIANPYFANAQMTGGPAGRRHRRAY